MLLTKDIQQVRRTRQKNKSWRILTRKKTQALKHQNNSLFQNSQQKNSIARIESIISVLMKENPIFQENLEYAKIVKYLVNLIHTNLTDEEFSQMTDEKLKENCSFVLSTEVMSKFFSNLSPEDMAIFDDAIQRK
ncbi:MAG: hypothetical protein ACRDB1_14065 [Microcoleaceae cyanobacterium]